MLTSEDNIDFVNLILKYLSCNPSQKLVNGLSDLSKEIEIGIKLTD